MDDKQKRCLVYEKNVYRELFSTWVKRVVLDPNITHKKKKSCSNTQVDYLFFLILFDCLHTIPLGMFDSIFFYMILFFFFDRKFI